MFKSRLLRNLLIALLVLAFAGYFAFSTFLFSPTEDDLEADLSTLAPENVDFYLAKAKLIDDFDELPRLASADAIETTRAWRAFEASGQWDALKRELGLDRAFQELARIQEQARGVDLLAAFGGEDVALAGFVQGSDISQANWCVYARVNWVGKLALSLARYPDLIGLGEQGLQVRVDGDRLEFSGANLPRPLHVARIRDVALVSPSPDLIAKAIELDAVGGAGSFGQGARYFDHVQNAPRTTLRDDAEIYVDWRKLAPVWRLPSPWPDPQSPSLATAIAGRLFQLDSIINLAGVVGIEGALQVNLHGDLTSERLTPVMQKLYRRRGADNAFFARDAARMVRSDAAVFAVAQIGLGDFLREVLASAEPALRANLEDLLRTVGEFKISDEAPTHTDRLINELDGLFKDRIALVVRQNDYPTNPVEDPPHDDTPVPAWAIALWTDGSEAARARLTEMQEIVNRNERQFGLSGRTAEEGGVYSNKCTGSGYIFFEFWSRLIPGTGHIATCVDDDLFVVSNNYKMVCELLHTRDNREGNPNYPRIADRPDFMRLASESLRQANVMAWIEPKALNAILSRFTERAVRDEIDALIDWKQERAIAENQLLRDDFGGRQKTELSTEEQQDFEQSINTRLDATRDRIRREQEPALRARYELTMTYATAISSMVAMVAFDPKSIELSLRAFLDVNEGEP